MTNDNSPPQRGPAQPGLAQRGPAQRIDRPALPKRFYKDVATRQQEGGGFAVALDGRPLRTPAKQPLALPSSELAEAVADEWRAQGVEIDPASMPLTKIVNSALDGVTGREAEVAADIVAYAGSDLVCYRADAPAELVARQAAAWDPVIAWARDSLGARFVLAEGVMPVAQPPEALEAVASALEGKSALWLGALHVMTTLTGSGLIALGHVRGALPAEAAWAAAHVDDDYQIEQWGEDAEAAVRRALRRAEFMAASRLAAG